MPRNDARHLEAVALLLDQLALFEDDPRGCALDLDEAAELSYEPDCRTHAIGVAMDHAVVRVLGFGSRETLRQGLCAARLFYYAYTNYSKFDVPGVDFKVRPKLVHRGRGVQFGEAIVDATWLLHLNLKET